MYTTTLSFDLYDILKLEYEIKQKSNSLYVKVNGLVYNNSNKELTIISASEFDEADISNITEAIENYSNTDQERDTKIVGLGIQNVKITNTDFTTIFVYDYKPRIDLTLKQIIIRSFCTNTQVSEPDYTIRIVNITYNQIIGENIFVNLNSNECSLDIVNTNDIHLNFRETHTLEIQVKINHPKSILTILSGSLLLEYI